MPVNERPKFRNAVVKNGTFRRQRGDLQRAKTLQANTTQAMKDFEKLCVENKISAKSRDYELYTDAHLSNFIEVQRDYCEIERVHMLKWSKYIRTQMALDKLANQICAPLATAQEKEAHSKTTTKTLVAYGGGATGKGTFNQGMRGYAHVPNKGLLAALQRNKNCEVFVVDEYNTTQRCSGFCGARLLFADRKRVGETKRNHGRSGFCPKCRLTWNRDVNAANNMVWILRNLILGIPRPSYLQRPVEEDVLFLYHSDSDNEDEPPPAQAGVRKRQAEGKTKDDQGKKARRRPPAQAASGAPSK